MVGTLHDELALMATRQKFNAASLEWVISACANLPHKHINIIRDLTSLATRIRRQAEEYAKAAAFAAKLQS